MIGPHSTAKATAAKINTAVARLPEVAMLLPPGALIASYRAIMTRGALTRWIRALTRWKRGPGKWDRTKRRLLTSLSTSTLKGKHSIKVVI